MHTHAHKTLKATRMIPYIEFSQELSYVIYTGGVTYINKFMLPWSEFPNLALICFCNSQFSEGNGWKMHVKYEK